MKKIDIKYILLCFFSGIFLIVIFVLVNTNIISTKELEEKIDKVTKEYTKTTTTVQEYETHDIEVDGVVNTINIDTYNSLLGFSIKYDVDNLEVNNQSDETVIFVNKNNKNNYLKIFKLSEDVYKSEYESNLNGEYKSNEEIDTNTYEYTFYRIGSNYFKVMKSIQNDDKNYNSINGTFEYMISTLDSH